MLEHYGFGVAVAVIEDAVLIRAVLTPAFLSISGGLELVEAGAAGQVVPVVRPPRASETLQLIRTNVWSDADELRLKVD